jgi:uncharacterized protein YneF (UPF0154 family)
MVVVGFSSTVFVQYMIVVITHSFTALFGTIVIVKTFDDDVTKNPNLNPMHK